MIGSPFYYLGIASGGGLWIWVALMVINLLAWKRGIRQVAAGDV
jgi:cytochrome c oxidase subunit 1